MTVGLEGADAAPAPKRGLVAAESAASGPRLSNDMTLLAIFGALVATFAAVTRWLIGISCQSGVESRFPEYARRIFRPPHQVLLRQGGPVRAWALLPVSRP